MPLAVIPQGVRPQTIVRTQAGPVVLAPAPWIFYVVKQDVSAAFTLTLPAAPLPGAIVTVSDGAGTMA